MPVADRPRSTGAFFASLDAAAAADPARRHRFVLPGGLVPGGHPSTSLPGGGPATVDRHGTAARL